MVFSSSVFWVGCCIMDDMEKNPGIEEKGLEGKCMYEIVQNGISPHTYTSNNFQPPRTHTQGVEDHNVS